MAVEITDSNIDTFLMEDKPLVIDFGAEWCAPCRILAPIIEELAEEYKDRIDVGTCDVEDNNALATRYTIRNVPTLLFVRGGEIVERHVGMASAETLRSKFEALLQ
ncbi:MAG: thioredoxin family protein [Alistipes indistinctus]|uniref:thioredoxin family protein n=1 Tax=Alistipes indistinctus TaxID=626932 RepID=UPI0032BF7994